MRFKPKYLSWALKAILVIGGGLAFFGIAFLPKDWGSAVKLLTEIDQWILSHATYPSLFIFVVVLFICAAIIPDALKLLTTLIALITPKTPKPDMKIIDVIDYIVNESAENLKQPSPPQIEEGRRLTETDVEHNDALRLTNEKLANGELHAWGLKEVTSHIANRYDTFRRPILTKYWELMALHPVTCFNDTERMAQTITSPGPMGYPKYAGLMLMPR